MPFVKITVAIAFKLHTLTGRHQMTFQDKYHNSTSDLKRIMPLFGLNKLHNIPFLRQNTYFTDRPLNSPAYCLTDSSC